jgi:hypothetical protein
MVVVAMKGAEGAGLAAGIRALSRAKPYHATSSTATITIPQSPYRFIRSSYAVCAPAQSGTAARG